MPGLGEEGRSPDSICYPTTPGLASTQRCARRDPFMCAATLPILFNCPVCSHRLKVAHSSRGYPVGDTIGPAGVLGHLGKVDGRKHSVLLYKRLPGILD